MRTWSPRWGIGAVSVVLRSSTLANGAGCLQRAAHTRQTGRRCVEWRNPPSAALLCVAALSVPGAAAHGSRLSDLGTKRTHEETTKLSEGSTSSSKLSSVLRSNKHPTATNTSSSLQRSLFRSSSRTGSLTFSPCRSISSPWLPTIRAVSAPILQHSFSGAGAPIDSIAPFGTPTGYPQMGQMYPAGPPGAPWAWRV